MVDAVRTVSRKKTLATDIPPAGVKLRQWLMTQDITVQQLGHRTGFAAGTLYGYINGQPNTYPSLAQAFAIEYATNGYVPAWLWLDNPYIAARVRNGQLAGAKMFEGSIKSFVLKFNSLKTVDGMIRHKARILSRLFGVEWGEVRQRLWADAKRKAKAERADISMYMRSEDDQAED